MGCSFNYVEVPPEVKKVSDLKKFHKQYRTELLQEYGDDCDGYTGNMAVDDGNLIVRSDLKLDYEGPLDDESIGKIWGELLAMCSEAGACKWGPSVAIRVGSRWLICGFYSD